MRAGTLHVPEWAVSMQVPPPIQERKEKVEKAEPESNCSSWRLVGWREDGGASCLLSGWGKRCGASFRPCSLRAGKFSAPVCPSQKGFWDKGIFSE